MDNDTELRVTPAEEWQPKTTVVQLPSGRVVRLRQNVSLLDCLERGQVPDPLVKLVMDTVQGAPMSAIQDDPALMAQYLNWLAEKMIVEPMIWDGKGKQPKGSISAAAFREMLPDDDRVAIANFATQGVTALLGPFREE
jgi:hypothetical protein